MKIDAAHFLFDKTFFDLFSYPMGKLIIIAWDPT